MRCEGKKKGCLEKPIWLCFQCLSKVSNLQLLLITHQACIFFLFYILYID